MKLHKSTNEDGVHYRLTGDHATEYWTEDRNLRGAAYFTRRASGLCMIQLSVDDNSDDAGINLTLAFPHIGYMKIGVENVPDSVYEALGLRKFYDERTIGLSFHDEGVWWDIWKDPMSWKSSDPKWMHGVFRPLDLIFGKRDRIYMDDRPPVHVQIPMPEGTYDAVMRMSRWTYKRPRWPFNFGPETMFKVYDRHDTSIPEGIGFPGKGENSWDCGDDATYGLGGPATTVEEAIGSIVANILRTRKKNGGSHEFTPSGIGA